ncbi:hypothetical protein JT358_11595 [Micrococcales bacterium 31B]|nr:hypothetical protein [Micrococcales bacterium 31B]
MWIKGINGQVVDLPEHVATGLIGGGHAERVDDPEAKKPRVAKRGAPAAADATEE